MDYCVVVQAHGKELDYLRGEAYRVARDARTDWCAEPRKLGTAFCFENADVRRTDRLFAGLHRRYGSSDRDESRAIR